MLLSMAMALTLLPAAALATEGGEGDVEPPAAVVAEIDGEPYYGTFQDAAKAAKSGETITLLGDITLEDTTTDGNNSVITLPAGVRLDGGGNTITLGTFANESHVLGFEAGGATTTVENLIIDGNNGGTDNENDHHCINAYGAVNVVLKDVTLQNSNAAGMVIMNGANVTATNLTTSDNAWGAVNVDNNDYTGETTFTLESGTLNEAAQIWTEKPEDVSIVVPAEYEEIVGFGKALKGFTYYTTDVAKLAVASITKDETTTYYETLADAVEKAAENDKVTLVQDVILDAKLEIAKSITIDGNGKVITGAADNNGVYFEITAGTVAFKNATITGFGSSAGTNSGVAVFKVPSGSSDVNFTAENLTVNNFCRSAFDIRAGEFLIKDCTIDCSNENENKLTKAILAGLGTEEVTGSIEGCTITNTANTYDDWSTGGVEVYAPATVSVKDCTLTGVEDGITANIYYGTGDVLVTVVDTTIAASKKALRVDGNEASQGDNTAAITVESGSYTGALGTNFYDANCSITISGGQFTSDPTDYVADGKIATVISDAPYLYEVVEKANPDVEVAPAAPAVSTDTTEKTEAVTTAMENTKSAMESTPPTVTGLTTAAGEVANAVTTTADDGKKELEDANVSVDGDVTIYVQPYLDIVVTDAKVGEDSAITELTLEITPMVKTVASTAASADEIKLDDGETKNAMQIGDAKELEVTTPITITIPLPEGFDAENLMIRHVKENGDIYYYAATIAESPKAATFTVTHGFSTFILTKDSRSTTVTFGDDIGEKTYTAPNVGDTLPTDSKSGYTFTGWKFTADGEAIEGATGTYTTMTDDLLTALAKVENVTATAQFSKKSSGGGGSSASNYTLTFEVNGGSSIAKVTKTSGTTVDLASYQPTREGYTFAGWFSDKALTKEVTSVKLTANTTVYAKWTEISPVSFTDVETGAYYYDAVLWAVQNNVTQGVSATAFAPDATCTRAQTVTFLWRAMGEPEPASATCPFTDVADGAYYYKAVLWANEQGITTGTTATTFSPDDTVTRSQVAVFLWRAAEKPAAGTSAAFTDVESGAYYADAVAWAVAEDITKGTSSTTFSPLADCTRGQIVTFLYRYLGA